jgi:hypothetical protein
MKAAGPEHQLRAQLARELCAILDGYQHELGAASHSIHRGPPETDLAARSASQAGETDERCR